MNHSPGPWSIEKWYYTSARNETKAAQNIYIATLFDINGEYIAEMEGDPRNAKDDEKLRLLSTVPKMLELIKRILMQYEERLSWGKTSEWPTMEETKRLIAEIEGAK